jgi:hypothetical protein
MPHIISSGAAAQQCVAASRRAAGAQMTSLAFPLDRA